MASSHPSLDPDTILKEASQRADSPVRLGGGPGEAFFMEGLQRLLESLEQEGRLNAIGRGIARERVLLHVTNRLLYVRDRARHPEISQERIVAPVFIVGMPRTGTTILHDILAQDPSSRAPLTWETMFPSPPPEAATFETDPRIELCAATFPDVDAQIPAFKAMHPMGAQLSQECVTMMGETMCTPLFHNQFRVPAYQDWVDREADLSHVYAFHERQLQHLQWRNERDRWVLKTGAHMWGLEHLLRTYPDARIVFTHRDPVKTMTSYASLTALVRSMGSDEVDPIEIADDWTRRIKRVLEHAIGVRETESHPRAIFYDMHFQDFVTNPFAVVERIYDAFDLPLSGEAADRMRAYIADNPKDKHGIHRYSPEQFGVRPDAVREAFRPYLDRFGLEPESI
ncbi:MAG TPA: sulfotransferase [Myxococcota bacterium]|nr:sulfotransferase [Myxococcota bacterium]